MHDEPDDYFMLQTAFPNGISALGEFNLTYDLRLFPKHIPAAQQLVEKFPEQPFVLDHIAKPSISKKEFSPWQENMINLAKFPNVYCKLSGMVIWYKQYNDWFRLACMYTFQQLLSKNEYCNQLCQTVFKRNWRCNFGR